MKYNLFLVTVLIMSLIVIKIIKITVNKCYSLLPI